MTLTDLTALPDAEINRRVATLLGLPEKVRHAFPLIGNACRICKTPYNDSIRNDYCTAESPTEDYATSWNSAIGAVRAWGNTIERREIFDSMLWRVRGIPHTFIWEGKEIDLCVALLLAAGDDK